MTRATGQPFEIAGDLQISWYPWLALRMGPAQFGKTPGSQGAAHRRVAGRARGREAHSADAGRADHRPHPAGRCRSFICVKRADGRANWDEVIASFKSAAEGADRGPNTAPGPQIAGFEVRDGTLEYTDERHRQARLRSAHWRLDVGEWRAGAATFPCRDAACVSRVSPRQRDGRRPSAAPLEADRAGGRARARLRRRQRHRPLRPRVHAIACAAGRCPRRACRWTFQVSRLAARLSPLDIGISECRRASPGAKLTASIQAGETGPEKTLVRARAPGPADPVRARVPAALGVKAPLPLDKGTFGALQPEQHVGLEGGRRHRERHRPAAR